MTCRAARGTPSGNWFLQAPANVNASTGGPDDDFGENVDIDVAKYGDELADDGTAGLDLLESIAQCLVSNIYWVLVAMIAIGLIASMYFGYSVTKALL